MTKPLAAADDRAAHSTREGSDANSSSDGPRGSSDASEATIADAGVGGEPLRPKPEAVVFDANLWGRYLNVKSLTHHAQRLKKSGIEVWIPTQVALEWAQHTHEHIEIIQSNWQRVQRSGIFGPLPEPSEVQDVATKAIEVLKAIPNVTVLDMTGAAAVAGIIDQILQTGSGTRLKGVKTGASDSSFVRDALAAAEDDPARIVFVSSNRRDIEDAAMAAGHPHVNICPLQDLYRLLFTANKASEPVTELVATKLLSMAATRNVTLDPHSPPDPWIEVGNVQLDTSLTAFDYVTGAAIEHGAHLLGIMDIEVVDWEHDQSEFNSTVEFTLLLLANVAVDGYTIDAEGQVLSGSAVIGDIVVRAPFIVDISDMAIVSLQSNGAAKAAPATDRWHDPYDALYEMTEFLESLAGITLISPDADWMNLGVTLMGLHDRSVVVEPAGDGDQWELVFDLGGREEVTISCQYDPGARVWDGKHGFDAIPPYYLSSAPLGYAEEPFTALAAVWRYLVAAPRDA